MLVTKKNKVIFMRYTSCRFHLGDNDEICSTRKNRRDFNFNTFKQPFVVWKFSLDVGENGKKTRQLRSVNALFIHDFYNWKKKTRQTTS